MHLEELRTYLLAKPNAGMEMPFGIHVLIFKVERAMFARVAWQENPLRITLRCDPQRALLLRGLYTAVQPGQHMNRRQWITVLLDGSIARSDVRTMIDESYDLVTAGAVAPPSR